MSLFKRPTNGPRMREMADVVGLDLQTELAVGTVAPYEIRAAERLCGECRGSRECEIWLEAHRDAQPEQPPHYCPNRGLYRELKRAAEQE